MKKKNIDKYKEKELKGTSPDYTTNPVTDNKTTNSGNIVSKKCSDAEFSRDFSIENKK